VLEAARLYAITPDAEPDAVVGLVGAVLRGGADVVQLRHKTLARGRLLELATRLAELVHRAGRLFIVNDHLDIALIAGADGVHLGDTDLPLAAARRVAGERLLIGASANTAELARAAVAAGADYLGAGPAFATAVKPDKAVIGPAGVAAVAAAVAIPVFAIGGVDAGNIDRLLAAGVRRACVIRGLAESADPETAARLLRSRLAS
jgi:thiamine-phosphate pyrophosphorylase